MRLKGEAERPAKVDADSPATNRYNHLRTLSNGATILPAAPACDPTPLLPIRLPPTVSEQRLPLMEVFLVADSVRAPMLVMCV